MSKLLYAKQHIDLLPDGVVAMPAPRQEPYKRICITLPDRIIDRLAEYPGEQSWKIEMLVEYALRMGALMSPEEADQIAADRADKVAAAMSDNKRKSKRA